MFLFYTGLHKLRSWSGLQSDGGWDWDIQDSFIHKSSVLAGLAGRLGLSHSLNTTSLVFLT